MINKDRRITSLADLISGLPTGHRSMATLEALGRAYAQEMVSISRHEDRAEHTLSVLSNWRRAGSQYIAEFWVNNMALEIKDQYNFHGQNVSRWLYAGAICYDEESRGVSTHH